MALCETVCYRGEQAPLEYNTQFPLHGGTQGNIFYTVIGVFSHDMGTFNRWVEIVKGKGRLVSQALQVIMPTGLSASRMSSADGVSAVYMFVLKGGFANSHNPDKNKMDGTESAPF